MSTISEKDYAKMTAAQQVALINQLAAERDALAQKVAQRNTLTLKFRDPAIQYPTGKKNKDGTDETAPGSGAFSLYGLGRFPVTLYATGWERLVSADTVKMILDTIAAHPQAPRK